ncbi:MAG: histidine triad protein [Candidatus Tyloplasma litorale]|nr:MAG: histidine triad protein [Mycoplasmatales bacterium]
MDKSIFELIIEGKLPSLKIYEDENFVAFLDKFPKQKGHTLVVPKKKSLNIIEDSDFVKENILKIGSKIAQILIQKLNATGIKMIINNGKSAGQVVFHTHLHLIPYYEIEQEKINNVETLKEILGE